MLWNVGMKMGSMTSVKLYFPMDLNIHREIYNIIRKTDSSLYHRGVMLHILESPVHLFSRSMERLVFPGIPLLVSVKCNQFYSKQNSCSWSDSSLIRRGCIYVPGLRLRLSCGKNIIAPSGNTGDNHGACAVYFGFQSVQRTECYTSRIADPIINWLTTYLRIYCDHNIQRDICVFNELCLGNDYSSLESASVDQCCNACLLSVLSCSDKAHYLPWN